MTTTTTTTIDGASSSTDEIAPESKGSVKNGGDENESASSNASNVAMIGGIVGGAVGLLVIVGIVVAMVMVRRARARKGGSGEKSNRSISVISMDTDYATMEGDHDNNHFPSYNDVKDVRAGNNAYY